MGERGICKESSEEVVQFPKLFRKRNISLLAGIFCLYPSRTFGICLITRNNFLAVKNESSEKIAPNTCTVKLNSLNWSLRKPVAPTNQPFQKVPAIFLLNCM